MSFQKPLSIPGRRKVLTKNMILDAQTNSKSASECARWLSVSYNTYKKWAKYYGLFENHKNQSGLGIKKGWAAPKIKMEDIFEGKAKTNYSLSRLKQRLISEGYMQEECSVCGWNEERITDNKICLTLDFIDGDRDNFKIENLRILCPNCYLSYNGLFHKSKFFCK